MAWPRGDEDGDESTGKKDIRLHRPPKHGVAGPRLVLPRKRICAFRLAVAVAGAALARDQARRHIRRIVSPPLSAYHLFEDACLPDMRHEGGEAPQRCSEKCRAGKTK
uniref:Uncharacterized protein n=1 Tax=Leersia perrieri TaxID=77586 RepID=A0A0D9XV18_9ORYZ